MEPTDRDEKLLTALLSQPRIAAAAASLGITERTIYRRLQVPEFARLYREARRQAVAQAVARLQAAAGEAVETLRAVMANPGAPASSRVAAARRRTTWPSASPSWSGFWPTRRRREVAGRHEPPASDRTG